MIQLVEDLSDEDFRELVDQARLGESYLQYRLPIIGLIEDHEESCVACTTNGRYYWSNLRDYQKRCMAEFDVEWDPTIRF